MYNLEPITLSRKNDKKNFFPKRPTSHISVRIHTSQQKIKHHFQFQVNMYDKNLKSVTSHDLDSPSLCHKLSHLLRPPPSSSTVTYFMDGPLDKSLTSHCSLDKRLSGC